MQWPSIELEPGSDLAEKVRRYGSAEVPRKLEKLVALVDDNVKHKRKTLVWSNIVAVLRDLHERTLAPTPQRSCTAASPPAAKTSPGTRARRRSAASARTHDCWVLIANPAAMSEGISLHHECHDAVYVDRTFNAGQYLQSIDRIHRLGLEPGTETRDHVPRLRRHHRRDRRPARRAEGHRSLGHAV